jgi:hypothetical protein
MDIMPASWQRYCRIPTDFPDGLGHTIVFTEKLALCGSGGTIWGQTDLDYYQPVFAAWTTEIFQIKPLPGECDPRRASTPFNGLNVTLADGSVQTLYWDLSQETWWAACTPDGDEVMGEDW